MRKFYFKPDFLYLIIIFLTFPLFFYKLGDSSLVSWDEAWYGDIARNILKSGDFINLVWNGHPYFDHPPFGYIFMAISQAIFGVNEFGVRFASAFFGMMSLFLTFLIGRKLFDRLVGFLAAVSLSSSTWFLFRARSGNLDTILTFMFLLTFYFALKSRESKSFFIPFAFSFCGLLLTKTMVPFTIIPLLVLVFWRSKVINQRNLSFLAMSILLTFGCWFILQTQREGEFINRYFGIGLVGYGTESSFISNIKLTKDYLYNGIGKWFWLTIVSTLGAVLYGQKRFYYLIIFISFFLAPFVFSPKGQIWHLIPVHPFLLLTFFGFNYLVFKVIFRKYHKYFYLCLMFICCLIFYNQTRSNYYQFIDLPRYISDEAILSREAGNFVEPLLTDGDFDPAAVFYSGKNVRKIRREELELLLGSNERFLLITNDWRLEEITSKDYQVLKKDRDKVLILHPAE